MIGTTLAHYKVTAALGVGGMGEVWRAEDEKLGREVALKVLPEEFAQDPERMARFEREAKVLASLNHPNIAMLYGLETCLNHPSWHPDGWPTGRVEAILRGAEPEAAKPSCRRCPACESSDDVSARTDSPTTFLVMELVEGEDLSERIKRGPIPVEEATAIALQIAEALEAAHESGIVHRDLKPANIKLRPDGTVKVLDFGLAKAWETDHGDSSISMSPTLTQHATAAGIILGTAAYMSPEQAAGIAADRRADIWAFGVVFWEMLTGNKLFEGETVSHVLAAVLKDDIDLDALPGDTPARLKELIGRCLKKKPKQRLQAIGDARVVLEEYAADPESFEALAAADGVPAAVIPLWRRLLPWAATAVLALALAAVVFLRPSPHDLAVRFQIVAPDNLTEVGPPTISPDGRTIAFEATDEKGATLIWVRSMDDLQARPLAGTEGATRPFWSPDSRYLAFIAGGKLKKVPLAGGPPQTLAETPSGSDGTWSSRGEILFDGRSGDPIRRVAASGGTPQDLITADPEDGIISVGWPQFLPDGRRFLYVANGAETDERFLMVGDIEDKEPPRKLLDVSSLVRFAPPDHLLYVREDSLLAQPFDPDSAELQGEAVPLAEELGATSTGLSGFFGVERRHVGLPQRLDLGTTPRLDRPQRSRARRRRPAGSLPRDGDIAGWHAAGDDRRGFPVGQPRHLGAGPRTRRHLEVYLRPWPRLDPGVVAGRQEDRVLLEPRWRVVRSVRQGRDRRRPGGGSSKLGSQRRSLRLVA